MSCFPGKHIPCSAAIRILCLNLLHFKGYLYFLKVTYVGIEKQVLTHSHVFEGLNFAACHHVLALLGNFLYLYTNCFYNQQLSISSRFWGQILTNIHNCCTRSYWGNLFLVIVAFFTGIYLCKAFSFQCFNFLKCIPKNCLAREHQIIPGGEQLQNSLQCQM